MFVIDLMNWPVLLIPSKDWLVLCAAEFEPFKIEYEFIVSAIKYRCLKHKLTLFLCNMWLLTSQLLKEISKLSHSSGELQPYYVMSKQQQFHKITQINPNTNRSKNCWNWRKTS